MTLPVVILLRVALRLAAVSVPTAAFLLGRHVPADHVVWWPVAGLVILNSVAMALVRLPAEPTPR